MGVRELAAALGDLVLPGDCAGCGAPPVPWCPACAATLGPPRPVRLDVGFPVLAAGRYRGPLREAVLRYKERGRRDLARPLASLLVGLVPAGARLVPAPSRPAAARARGGDHVLRLCRAAAGAHADLDVVAALALRRGAADSVGLDARARAANLAGRVVVRPGALPAAVLLVDDVVTTGATLRACGAALAGAGTRVAGAVVLCDATGIG